MNTSFSLDFRLLTASERLTSVKIFKRVFSTGNSRPKATSCRFLHIGQFNFSERVHLGIGFRAKSVEIDFGRGRWKSRRVEVAALCSDSSIGGKQDYSRFDLAHKTCLDYNCLFLPKM